MIGKIVVKRIGGYDPKRVPSELDTIAEDLGVTVSWSYDGVSVLILTVIKTSWYDPSVATIEADLAQLVAGCE